MKTAKEIKELLNKAEQGDSDALKQVVDDTNDKLKYIEELEKNKAK